MNGPGDVFLKADCDAGVRQLSDGLGWRKDLDKRLKEMQGLSNGAGWKLLVAAQQTSDETGHLE